MIKLYGFAASNYFNIAKHALLFKGIDFEEVTVYPRAGKEYLEKSPVGKVPCIETEQGFLSETNIVLEYLEEVFPEPPLYPAEVFAKAKLKEIIKISELYIELSARMLLPGLLMGFDYPDDKKNEAKFLLTKGLAALEQVVSFNPYVAGEQFTAADIFLQQTLAVANMVSAKFFDWDLLDTVPGMAQWHSLVSNTDISKTVADDAREAGPAFRAHMAALAQQAGV